MDCQMPERDGYETTRLIRAEGEAAFRHIPIVAMTANAIKGDRERCLAAGMDGYIAKPVEAAALSRAIQTALRQAGTGKTYPMDPSLASRLEELRHHVAAVPEDVASREELVRELRARGLGH
jgi:DNA-binding NarL/FixJ family response regulator